MRATAALLIGTSFIAVASPAAAQTQSETVAQAVNPPPSEPQEEAAIIVTATKRASTVQEVPFSVNAQTQADIQRANAQTIEDISRNVAASPSRTSARARARSPFAASPPVRSFATSPA